MLANIIGSVSAMERIKNKFGYGQKQESYAEYSARRKQWIPLSTWYLDEMSNLPTQWPTDQSEQKKLVNKISEFAEKYLKTFPDSREHADREVNIYLSALERDPKTETSQQFKQKLLKQHEVLKKALREYQLKIQAEESKLKARL